MGISVIVAVLVTVLVGWYTREYQPLRQTVIKVNDTEFDMDYYVKALKFHGRDQPADYIYALANDVVVFIVRDELIRQGAAKLGISVSEDDVDDEFKSHDPPLTDDYRDLVRTELLVRRLNNEYIDPQVPVFAEHRRIMAMFLESESQVEEVKARLDNGEDFTELAGEFSLESFSKSEGGDLGWQPEGILTILLGSPALDEYAFSSEIGTLSPPIQDETIAKDVGYWLIEVLERQEDSDEAHVQAILLGSAQEARMIKDRLDAGEDFAALAEEYSQHDEFIKQGGDFGWLALGDMSTAFDGFAFDLGVEVEMLSEAIRDEAATTEGGYWLVKVSDIDDNKELVDEGRDLLKSEALNEWGSSLWDDPEYEIDDSYLTAEKKEWAVQRATGG